jgi:hypothetical protein
MGHVVVLDLRDRQKESRSLMPRLFQDGQCRYDPSHIGATAVGITDIEYGDEEQLKQAVATVGPISVAIDASLSSFRFYHSGMLLQWCVGGGGVCLYKLLITENYIASGCTLINSLYGQFAHYIH